LLISRDRILDDPYSLFSRPDLLYLNHFPFELFVIWKKSRSVSRRCGGQDRPSQRPPALSPELRVRRFTGTHEAHRTADFAQRYHSWYFDAGDGIRQITALKSERADDS